MFNSITNSIWGIIKDALDNIMHTIVMSKKDEWVEELTKEIDTTDSAWVKLRNTIYLSWIEKIVSEETEKDA